MGCDAGSELRCPDGLAFIAFQEKVQYQAQLEEAVASLSDRGFSKRDGMDEHKDPHQRVDTQALRGRALKLAQ